MTDGNALGRMWRDVYQKAASVADARTEEQLKYHVYAYHPGGGGGGAGPYVLKAGDTMTGTLNFQGPDTIAGGAIDVFGSGAVADARLYGPATPAYAPADVMTPTAEYEQQFRADVATYLVAVRWYRGGGAFPTPSAVHLWDTTATGSPVWTIA